MFQNILGQLDMMHMTAGLLVGVMVGLTGVGGGALMASLLVLMFGIKPKAAVGTDLLFAAITKTVGSTVQDWRDTADCPPPRTRNAGKAKVGRAVQVVVV